MILVRLQRNLRDIATSRVDFWTLQGELRGVHVFKFGFAKNWDFQKKKKITQVFSYFLAFMGSLRL